MSEGIITPQEIVEELKEIKSFNDCNNSGAVEARLNALIEKMEKCGVKYCGYADREVRYCPYSQFIGRD